uniref:Uncharacterized protein n=1 Tax=Opuntia streptacantha TaxID=393608 RepID=A0A7C9AML9_OPUST
MWLVGVAAITGFLGDLTHSLRYGSDKFLGWAKFWTWKLCWSMPVYRIAGLLPGSMVVDPDQQPLISYGSDGFRAVGCGVQLMRSVDVECPHSILVFQTGA